MSNNARGTIWMDPAQFQVPKSDCTQQPANVSFFGHVKVSQRKMEAAPPDPALRYKSVGAGWRRPAWTPLPEQDCTAILTEGWKFTIQPPENYWLNDSDPADWDDVTVPAELMALGYDIKRDREYVYKKKLDIPAEWKDKVIILKFGMSYEYTKIWIDGQFVRDHEGGFTSYECNISE